MLRSAYGPLLNRDLTFTHITGWSPISGHHLLDPRKRTNARAHGHVGGVVGAECEHPAAVVARPQPALRHFIAVGLAFEGFDDRPGAGDLVVLDDGADARVLGFDPLLGIGQVVLRDEALRGRVADVDDRGARRALAGARARRRAERSGDRRRLDARGQLAARGGRGFASRAPQRSARDGGGDEHAQRSGDGGQVLRSNGLRPPARGAETSPQPFHRAVANGLLQEPP